MIDIIGIIFSIRSKSRFSKYAFYYFLFSLLGSLYIELYTYLVRNDMWFNIADNPRMMSLSVLPSSLFGLASVATIFVALIKLK